MFPRGASARITPALGRNDYYQNPAGGHGARAYPEEHRKDFYLYVDEFQNFVTDAFAGILSEARKYRLNLTVAHQYTAQLVMDKSSASGRCFRQRRYDDSFPGGLGRCGLPGERI